MEDKPNQHEDPEAYKKFRKRYAAHNEDDDKQTKDAIGLINEQTKQQYKKYNPDAQNPELAKVWKKIDNFYNYENILHGNFIQRKVYTAIYDEAERVCGQIDLTSPVLKEEARQAWLDCSNAIENKHVGEGAGVYEAVFGEMLNVTDCLHLAF